MGIIYVSGSVLGWEPLAPSWLNTRREKEAAVIKGSWRVDDRAREREEKGKGPGTECVAVTEPEKEVDSDSESI
eukprot:3211062-Rhodomonas_salina.1